MTEQGMLKEALEWQEHIRKLITDTDDELYHKRSKVFDWLIKQAEKVELLENTIKETLDTLKRGGPGTRSQVQALLENALEGKENE